jgi:hypothetical protein
MSNKKTNYCRVLLSTNLKEKMFVCFADEEYKCQFFKESKHSFLPSCYICHYRRESKYILDYCLSNDARKNTQNIVFQNILKEIEKNNNHE